MATSSVVFSDRYKELTLYAEQVCSRPLGFPEALATAATTHHVEATPKAWFRASIMNTLDTWLVNTLDQRLNIKLPSAFQRWRMCQYLLGPNLSDPLLPDTTQIDSGLFHELKRNTISDTEATRMCSDVAVKVKIALAHLASFSVHESVPTKFRILDLQDTPDTCEIRCAAAPSTHKHLVHTQHMTKLRERYLKATHGRIDGFPKALWHLLTQYESIAGLGYQAAIPSKCFEVLGRRFGVHHECFASPLNHTLPSYGSAFPNTDRIFGSEGDFFDLDLSIGGSFEANPPFVEEIMAAMALKVYRAFCYLRDVDQLLLDLSLPHSNLVQSYLHDPLSFVIIWPGWTDTPGFDILTKLARPFLKGMFDLKSGEHYFHEGAQHRSGFTLRLSKAATNVFVLQDKEAAKKWPCTLITMKEIVYAFQP